MVGIWELYLLKMIIPGSLDRQKKYRGKRRIKSTSEEVIFTQNAGQKRNLPPAVVNGRT